MLMNSTKEERNKEKAAALSLQRRLMLGKLTKPSHTGIFILRNPFVMLKSDKQSATELAEKFKIIEMYH